MSETKLNFCPECGYDRYIASANCTEKEHVECPRCEKKWNRLADYSTEIRNTLNISYLGRPTTKLNKSDCDVIYNYLIGGFKDVHCKDFRYVFKNFGYNEVSRETSWNLKNSPEGFGEALDHLLNRGFCIEKRLTGEGVNKVNDADKYKKLLELFSGFWSLMKNETAWKFFRADTFGDTNSEQNALKMQDWANKFKEESPEIFNDLEKTLC